MSIQESKHTINNNIVIGQFRAGSIQRGLFADRAEIGWCVGNFRMQSHLGVYLATTSCGSVYQGLPRQTLSTISPTLEFLCYSSLESC